MDPYLPTLVPHLMLFEFTAYFEMSFKGVMCSMNTFKNSTKALTGVKASKFQTIQGKRYFYCTVLWTYLFHFPKITPTFSNRHCHSTRYCYQEASPCFRWRHLYVLVAISYINSFQKALLIVVHNALPET